MGETRERCVDLAFGAGFHNDELQPERSRRILCLMQVPVICTVGIHEHRDDAGRWEPARVAAIIKR